jgi:hypothetical protein
LTFNPEVKTKLISFFLPLHNKILSNLNSEKLFAQDSQNFKADIKSWHKTYLHPAISLPNSNAKNCFVSDKTFPQEFHRFKWNNERYSSKKLDNFLLSPNTGK